jgi:hypothetical protein
VLEVRVLGLRNRVKVDVDDLVEVAGDDLGDVIELGEVKGVAVLHEHGKGDGGKVADGDLEEQERGVG